MQIFIYTLLSIACLLFAFGLFSIVKIIFKTHSRKTTKAIRNISSRQKNAIVKSDGTSSYIQFLSRFIIMTKTREEQLENELRIAGIKETPRYYIATALGQMLKILALAIPVSLISPFLILGVILLAIYIYYKEKGYINKLIKEKRKEIDEDLPRFVSFVQQELRTSHDVLLILEKHKENFSETFNREISVTIADMRTGNYEVALQRLESRIGSSSLSEVVRGLIEMIKGNDTHIYWETLGFRLTEVEKERLRQKAQKIPPKVERLSFFLVMVMLLMYGVVFITVMMDSTSAFF